MRPACPRFTQTDAMRQSSCQRSAMDTGGHPHHVEEQQPSLGHQLQDAEERPPAQSRPLSLPDHELKSFLKRMTQTQYLAVYLAGLLLVVIALGVCIAVLLRSQCPDEPVHAEDEAIRVENVKNSEVLPPCRDGWLGYLDKCYFFSEKEANWDDAKHACASWNSSLAAIDHQREMDFVMRYKGQRDHWIGLRRESGQPWKWVNGTEFSNWFIIGDYSECAFLGSFVGSSGCHSKHNWICTSKPFDHQKPLIIKSGQRDSVFIY